MKPRWVDGRLCSTKGVDKKYVRNCGRNAGKKIHARDLGSGGKIYNGVGFEILTSLFRRTAGRYIPEDITIYIKSDVKTERDVRLGTALTAAGRNLVVVCCKHVMNLLIS
jgi:hypothetical protein